MIEIARALVKLQLFAPIIPFEIKDRIFRGENADLTTFNTYAYGVIRAMASKHPNEPELIFALAHFSGASGSVELAKVVYKGKNELLLRVMELIPPQVIQSKSRSPFCHHP